GASHIVMFGIDIIKTAIERLLDQRRAAARCNRPPAGTPPVLAIEETQSQRSAVSRLVADGEFGRSGRRGCHKQAAGKRRNCEQERERDTAHLSKGVGPSGCSYGCKPSNSMMITR